MKKVNKIVSVLLSASMVMSMSLTANAATTDPTQSQREKDNAALARRVAAQGMVLLEQNADNVLPIGGSSKPVALFGNGAIRTVRGGTGSGDPFNGGLSGGGDPLVNQSERYHVNIYDTFVREGYDVTTGDFLENFAVGYDEELQKSATNPMATFAYPEMQLTEDFVKESAEKTDTAIYVIARNAGEGADRSKTTKTATVNGVQYEVGDYELSQQERENLELVGKNFDKVAVVLNVGGTIDTKFFDEIEGLDTLLLMGQAGQEAGDALYDVVTGAVTPSGKLTTTWAENYSDYPASETFANNDGNIKKETYEEGIYVGYRYFDTFGITPRYEFGYGLSYTDFDMKVRSVDADIDSVTVEVEVTNTGDTYSGKEVVQVYYSAPDSAAAEKAYQELAGFEKTDELAPGQSQILTISYNTKDMAYYNEAKASYMLDKGDYVIRVGNSSRNTEVAGVVSLDADTVTEILSNQMHLPEEENLTEWSKEGETPYTYAGEAQEIADAPVFTLKSADFPAAPNNASAYDDETVNTYTTDPNAQKTQDYENIVQVADKSGSTLLDVYNGKVSMEEYVAQMSLEELADINCGSGWGVANENAPIVGSNSDTIPGAAGETTNKYFVKYGLPAIVVADGPGGIRVKQEYEATNVTTGEAETYYQYCTAWPVSVLRAQTWDVELLYEVGKAYAAELEEMGITIVLGPSLNIHRDPLCGRNFEYYSEDPIISGFMASAVTMGVQSVPGVGACLKHYAANNQESNRNAVDTIVSERVLREIYLKGFEIAVKASQPMSIMTSYNLINGVPAADDYDLCTDLPRGEWGFKGLIMTDWNGGSSTPAISMHGGNDLIMPGGPTRATNIVGGVVDVTPEFDERGQVALKEEPIMGTWTQTVASWGEFTIAADGDKEAAAQLGEGYTASVDEDGSILVNGEPIYRTYKSSWGGPGTFSDPVTTEFASVSEDGKLITYRGTYPENFITLGDVQKSAINNLKIIEQSIAMRAFYKDEDIQLVPYSSQFELAQYNMNTRSEPFTWRTITVEADEGASVNLDSTTAMPGQTVDFTVSVSDSAKEIQQVAVVSAQAGTQVLSAAEGAYSFTMPDEDVVLKVSLKDAESQNPGGDTSEPGTSEPGSSSGGSNPDKDSPFTGDSLPLMVLVVLVAMGAVTVLTVRKKRVR
ncbi:glycoside hydrolase family 3 protein [Candidatus Soleaferrea massiliensis]|uniref:glycoside hydrolase family 3 protein n=1 Tax=Candidatus Soleaferrea massiliensis TaxID=1470354 RepID=UPI000694DD7D|nr:glycoside hydrolase family 3 protein [Candidatus Soleaferrea massiliensis]